MQQNYTKGEEKIYWQHLECLGQKKKGILSFLSRFKWNGCAQLNHNYSFFLLQCHRQTTLPIALHVGHIKKKKAFSLLIIFLKKIKITHLNIRILSVIWQPLSNLPNCAAPKLTQELCLPGTPERMQSTCHAPRPAWPWAVPSSWKGPRLKMQSKETKTPQSISVGSSLAIVRSYSV